ncbi:stAR-related lipid transfer protein 8 isoform X2 [Nannospalax galili]|uniref:StAR related lipid transfer domain containing 8 n=2 Tax=Nannospalax galili TaxID=1026970 RepID=A0A8C6RY97_NANGA|nr:stAR-related lipid transfer protein 8 isoform X2 [Nannospalax galili]XP_029424793.1 stAR-related lipid transfer protein 8 isoform X2 [Nannospalax galili]XP_029424794.1 stAR-related lipid transfer protein 8 isoform X2 [Nannospalax galili]XP_029424795.1 stAR-related lipid transfer protein 8 isoform X2 [Nannospalax galili]
MTLNNCASMKLEVHFQCKQNEDSEEEEQCTISNHWAFEQESKCGSPMSSSALLAPPSPSRLGTSSCESVLTELSATSLPAITVSLAPEPADLPLLERVPSPSDQPFLSPTQGQESSQEKVKKHHSRSFLKHLESLRRKEKSDSRQTEPEQNLATSEKASKASSFRSCRGFLSAGFYRAKGRATTSARGRDGEIQKAWEAWPVATLRRPQPVHLRDCLVHVPGDHKPGTFPRSLSIESLCPEEGHHLADWQPGRCWGYEGRRGSCGSTGSHASIYDNLPELYPAEPVQAEIEAEDEDDSGGSYAHLDDILQHVWGLQQRVELWSQTMYPDLGPGDKEEEEEEEEEEEAPSSVEIATAEVEGQAEDLAQAEALVHRESPTQTQAEVPPVVLAQAPAEAKGLAHAEAEALAQVQDNEQEANSAGEPTSASSLSVEEGHSVSDTVASSSGLDSSGNSMNEAEAASSLAGLQASVPRERRDSGVGASLTRPCRKLRWHSFQNSHRPSLNSESLEINRQFAGQINLLHKGSLLRLTSFMEKYTVPHKQGWVWSVPKFMKRNKTPDYRGQHVFGVPPFIHVQRTGQPLPQSIQQAMRYLRSQCLDQVGIFRKSGVKSRIQSLRQMNETSPDNVCYEGQSAYDVADLLKQYFRDLPEPIFTSKLTTTFLQIYQLLPKEQWLAAAQAATLLLPDENREVLQTLLYFLSDIASAEENQMTAGNLAVCLAPSIFHLNISKKDSPSPRIKNKRSLVGRPGPRDLSENMAATQGLSHMISDCKKLFQVPQDMVVQLCGSYSAAELSPPGPALTELRQAQAAGVSLSLYMEESIQELLRDAAERFKGWTSVPGPQHTELACRKAPDGHPLRMWKASTEVAAPPAVVLHRVLRERVLWDEDLLRAQVLEALMPGVELYHYVTDSMAPHPCRDFVVLRMWRSDLPRGGCLLVSQSLDPEQLVPESGVRALMLTSQYLMEPCGLGRSRLTHICRADLRGRSPDWYNKVFGHLCAMEVAKIRDSFPTLQATGPETKL